MRLRLSELYRLCFSCPQGVSGDLQRSEGCLHIAQCVVEAETDGAGRRSHGADATSPSMAAELLSSEEHVSTVRSQCVTSQCSIFVASGW